MLDIAVIIVVARVFGRVARRLRQPAVVGEIVAGIALGPSLLGWLPGNLDTILFPPEVLPYLKILAQLGLVLFMFIVGLDLDLSLIRGRHKRAGAISLLSIMVPFGLGVALTMVLHPLHDQVDGESVPLVGLMLFMGVAMSITAFPVLARILTERRMNRTAVGVVSLAAAAIDDIAAWTLLAVVYAVVTGGSLLSVLRIVAMSAVFVAAMFLLVKPALARLLDWYGRAGRVTPDMLAVILVGILLSSLITERIGIHEIFGAFLFGTIMPRAGAQHFTRDILERIEQISVLLLLPIFFVVAGFGVNVRAFADASLLWQLALILLSAIGGKFLGAFLGARSQRMTVQHSSAIGVLMNTRGLTELVILLIGVQLAVLDTAMFTMMVIMALVTTAMTEPLLRFVYPEKAVQRDIEAAAKAALGPDQRSRVLVVVDSTPNAFTERMVQLADAVLPERTHGEILLTRFLTADEDSHPFELGAGPMADLAGMAEAVEALNRFAAGTTATTARLQVWCRFSSVPEQDVLRQVATSAADYLIISETWMRRYPEAFEALDAVTVLVVPAELPAAWMAAGGDAALALSTDVVYLRDDGEADGARAALVAARAARQLGRRLTAVVPGDRARRRLQLAFEPLRDMDIRIVPSGEPERLWDGEVTAAARVLDRTGGSQLNLRDAVADLG